MKRKRNNGFIKIILAAGLVFAFVFCQMGQIFWPLLQKAAMIGGALCMPEAVVSHIAHSVQPQDSEPAAVSQPSEPKSVASAPKPPEKADKPSVKAVISAESSR